MRIAVTGVGVVSPLGRGREILLRALCAGEVALRANPRLAAEGFRHHHAGMVAPEATPHATLPWACAMALAACHDALADSGLGEVGDAGLYVNTIHGGLTAIDAPLADWPALRLDDATTILRDSQGARVAALAQALHIHSEVQVIIGTCAGNLALDLALGRLRTGSVPSALVVGMEAVSNAAYAGFHQTRAVADACRPFDAARSGLVMGEGAACLVLEPLERAQARGAQVLAELLAVGCSNDAHDLVAPDPKGLGAERAMSAALERAGLAAAEIDYVSAHGTGTVLNDHAEGSALTRVFGSIEPYVSSIKGALGHTMGAASAIAAAAVVQTLVQSVAPCTAGLDQCDPTLPSLNHSKPPARIRAVLSNSFGFGGNNAVAVFATPGVGNPVSRRRRVFVRAATTLIAPQLDLDFASLLGKPLRHVDRTALLVAAAARDWLHSGDIDGIVIGCAHPSFHSAHKIAERIQQGGYERINPGVVPHATGNSAASWVAIRAAIRGYSATLATGDCAGLDAIVLASDQVATDLDEVIAGGVAAAHPDLWAALARCGRRQLAEGAALLVLSSASQRALAEVGPHACCFDAAQPVEAWRRAIAQVGAGLPVFEHVPEPLGASGGPDALAASAAAAAAAGAQHCAEHHKSVCVAAVAPEGFATALVLHPIGEETSPVV